MSFRDLPPEIAEAVQTVDTAADLPDGVGEGSIRYVKDEDLLYAYDGSGWTAVGSGGAGTGDVTGPASSTDNAVVRFNGTGGTSIQNSGVTVDDLNNVAGVAQLTLSGPIVDASLTASRALVSDASKNVVASSVTSTELGYVSGVTSAIQTQINAKQASDATLTALAAYNTNGLVTQTAADTFAGRTITGGTGISVTNGDGVAGNPTIATTITQYTDELAQDAVGTILTDTATIDFTYDDATPQITADVKDDSITDAKIKSDAAVAYSKLNLSDSVVNADVATAAAIARSKLAAGTAGHVVINDGTTGVFSSEATLAKSRGGTGQDNSSVTFPASGTVFANPMDSAGDLIVGGASGVATKLDAGSDGQILVAAGAAAPAWGHSYKGISSGSSPAAGYVGEYISAACSANSITVSADTDVDVTGMSISLTAGVWLIGYGVCAHVDRTAASANTVLGRLRVKTSGGTAVSGTEACFGALLNVDGSATDIMYLSVSRQTVISISGSTTYKLSVACSVANTAGTARVYANNVSAGLSEDDNNSVLWALRIA